VIQLQIESITLTNYRQYSKAKLDFTSPERTKFLTVIVGESGFGKTNILNAISWCLYGEELHLTGGKNISPQDENVLPIYNIPAFVEAKPMQVFSVSVEIVMNDSSGQKWVIERTKKFQKLKGDKAAMFPLGSNSPDSSFVSLTIQKKKGGNYEPQDNPVERIGSLVPKALEQYFLFDAEKIRDYFTVHVAAAIKEEVNKLSQVDTLSRAIERLEKKQDDFRRESRPISVSTAKLQEELQKIRDCLAGERGELRDFEAQKKACYDTIQMIETELRGCTEENVASLQKLKEEYDEAIRKLEDELESNEVKKQKALVKYAPIILTLPAIKSTSHVIARLKKAGELPPEYRRSFLKRLLQEGKCICGEDLSGKAGSKDRRTSVQKLLNDTDELSEASADISRFDGDMDRLESEATAFWEQLDEHGSTIKKIETEIEKRRIKIADIDGKLKGINIEKVSRLQERLHEAEKAKDEWSKRIGACEGRISDLKDDESDKAEELDEELKKTEKGLKLKKKIDFLGDAIETAERVRDSITKEVKGEVARLTNENFFSFISKKTAFEKVEITDEYEVNVVHALGWQARQYLSTGETQMLALAFFAALHRVSGLDMPIFIDAPLARISEAPTERIVEAFPKCFESKQVCLLMLDKEYRPVRDNFSPILCREYQILYSEKEEGYGASVVTDYA